MLICIAVGISCTAIYQPSTILGIITTAKGGFGKVSVTVKNIGENTAENITMMIFVSGGFSNSINITKICSGCGNCCNLIAPNATKTESTAEEGRIFGFGPIIINTYAEASNAEQVSKTFNGFILGFIVIIKK